MLGLMCGAKMKDKLCCRQRLQSADTTDQNGVGMFKKGRESLDAKDVLILKWRPKITWTEVVDKDSIGVHLRDMQYFTINITD